jgi:hypothetical protein
MDHEWEILGEGRRIMRNMLSAIFLLFSASWLFADEADSYAAAIEMSAKMNKPIIIEFWRDN